MPAPDRLRGGRGAFAERQARSSAASISCASISVSAQVPRLQAAPGSQGDAAAAGERGRPHLRLQRGEPAPRRRRPAAMFALYAAPAVNLFEKTTDRISDQAEPARIPCRARPQPLSRLRAAPGARGLCALLGRVAKRCRSIRSIRRRRRGLAARRISTTRCGVCRAARGRGAALRLGLRLHRHRHVHRAVGAGGLEERRRSPSSACGRSAPTATCRSSCRSAKAARISA